MSTGFMQLQVQLSNGQFAVLEGSQVRYWATCSGAPVYVGDIDGLPQPVIDELVQLKAIRRCE